MRECLKNLVARIMGDNLRGTIPWDALYLFGQTALVFALGGLGYASLDGGIKSGAEVLLMIALAAALLWPLIKTRMDMNLMLLTGVTLGLLFRSLSQLLSRLLDPNAFAACRLQALPTSTRCGPT